MAIVWIPKTMQDITNGEDKVIVGGATITQVINNLDKEFNGMKNRLMKGHLFRNDLNVYVDGGELGSNLLEKVEHNSEIHFLPAIGGKASARG